MIVFMLLTVFVIALILLILVLLAVLRKPGRKVVRDAGRKHRHPMRNPHELLGKRRSARWPPVYSAPDRLEYHLPMEIMDGEDEEGLPPPPFVFDGANPNADDDT